MPGNNEKDEEMDITTPPDGWFVFGSHVGFSGPLEFSEAVDETGLPLWERHPERGVSRDDLASAWDKGYAAHAIGITNTAGDPNPYRKALR